MDRIWPVKDIQLGEAVDGIWQKVDALMKSDEVFVLRYTADDDKSGYIYLSSYDAENETLIATLNKNGLDTLTPYAKKGELMVMW